MIAETKKQLKADYSKEDLFAEAEKLGLNPRKNLGLDSLVSLVFKALRSQLKEVEPEPEVEPEVKPEEKPEVKPEEKPEVKPEEKPEVKPEEKPEDPNIDPVEPNQPIFEIFEVYLPGRLGPTKFVKAEGNYYLSDKGKYYAKHSIDIYIKQQQEDK